MVLGFWALLGKQLSAHLSLEPQVPWQVVVTYHPMVAGAPLDTISFWVRKQKWSFKTQYPRQEHNTSTVITQQRYISNTPASKKQSFVARESYDYISRVTGSIYVDSGGG